MEQKITIYKLLLSCPGDASDVCYPIVESAIEDFNKEVKDHLVMIELIHWKTHSYPQSGCEAQDLLNKQIVDKADMAIGIFWTRFGTPTNKYGSGTEEEIDRLRKSKKQIFLYFLDKPVRPSETDSQEYIQHREKIKILKEKYNGLYFEVKDESELKEKLLNILGFF